MSILNAMSRPLRQRIALFLSLIMVTFTVCQGMALAAMPKGGMPVPMQSAGMSCHEAPGVDPAIAKPDCPSDCEHVVKASDSGPQFCPLSQVVAFVAYQWPDLSREAGAIQLAALPLHDPITDPPPTLRYHRFRE